MANKTITKTDVSEIKELSRRGQQHEALMKLAVARGDILHPEDVVAEAAQPDSVLHSSFEWDDSIAGHKFRLMQARVLINSIKIEYTGQERHAFINASVTYEDQTTRGYFPVQRVMDDKQIHKAALQQAVNDIEAAQRRYNRLKELKGVINTARLAEVKKELA